MMDKLKTTLVFPIKSCAKYEGAIASEDQEIMEENNFHDPDLGVMDAILVSTNKNLNDDVFLRDEVWAARHTPPHKPVNWEHDNANIIGHMFASKVVDKTGMEIDGDDVPKVDFDISVKAYIYKGALPTDATKLISGFDEGDFSVSMECWFTDYDYLVGQRVISRNEQTAFLDECLRAKGGSGKYGDEPVGRVLRNIIFGGVGVVGNPANPDSVINSVADTQTTPKVLVTEENDCLVASNVVGHYEDDKHKSGDCVDHPKMSCAHLSNTEVNTQMNEKEMQEAIKKLEAKIAEQEAQIAEHKSSEVNKKIEALQTELEAKGTEIEKLQEDLTAKDVELDAKADEMKAVDALKVKLEETEAALAEIEQSKALKERLEKLSDKYEMSDDVVAKHSDRIKTMSDEEFEVFAETLADFVQVKADETPSTEVTDDKDAEDAKAAEAALAKVVKPSDAELSTADSEEIDFDSTKAAMEIMGVATSEKE